MKIDLSRLADSSTSEVPSMVQELEGRDREEPTGTHQWPTRFISAATKVAPRRWPNRFISAGLKQATSRE